MPMETDEIIVQSTSTSSQEYERSREAIQTPPLVESSLDLPAVRPGSEPWHSHFPTQWLPVITRDIEVQRSDKRTQEPFSDAYISGMTSKRRKVLLAGKLTEPSALLAGSIKKAIEKTTTTTTSATAASSSSNRTGANRAGDVSTSIAADSIVQQSFREHLRLAVRSRTETDPNYSPERFPSCSSFVSSNQQQQNQQN